jgi:hypothetical protein
MLVTWQHREASRAEARNRSCRHRRPPGRHAADSALHLAPMQPRMRLYSLLWPHSQSLFRPHPLQQLLRVLQAGTCHRSLLLHCMERCAAPSTEHTPRTEAGCTSPAGSGMSCRSLEAAARDGFVIFSVVCFQALSIL